MYVVGTAIGQEVLKAGPDADPQPLYTRLLRAVLRDGLVTVRCWWQDEELAGSTIAGGPEADECDATFLDLMDQPHVSLVRVPGVLRAVFKVDRQLRSRGLNGLVLLPHTFTVCGGATLIVYLDAVLA